jgi:hypothetical protein
MLTTAPWILVVVNSVLAGVAAEQRKFSHEMETAPVAFALTDEPTGPDRPT